MNVVETHDLKKYFRQRGGSYFKKNYIKAIDGVSLNIEEGEIFGLVGETGSGKTTMGRVLLGLTEPTSGTVLIDGADMFDRTRKEMRELRTRIQMIFQDPYGALDPRFKIKNIIAEPLRLNHVEYDFDRIARTMEDAGLRPVEDYLEKYPHQVSGGQRQRILIARALVLDPEFLIADEPASMLDVSLKAGVLNYLKKINREQHRSMLVISHDISLATYLSREIAVLYLGKIVEKATKDEIVNNGLHPYTKLLIESVPELGKDIEDVKLSGQGELTHGAEELYACSFYPRCKFAKDICKSEDPQLREISSNHYVACHMV